MRHRELVLLCVAAISTWLLVTYALIAQQPASLVHSQTSRNLAEQLDKLEEEVKDQSNYYRTLLSKLQALKLHREKQTKKVEDEDKTEPKQEKVYSSKLTEGEVLPVLLIACNRESAVRRSLDLLLKYRPSQERFPIIVSQDCGHRPTKQAIQSYGNQVTLIQQPDLTDIEVPLKERKFKGYFLIARHYKWALDQVFKNFRHNTVIIVEDDLDISPDFYEYFAATLPILRKDSSLWCVSAWNDNGKSNLVDVNNATLLYRTDFFPGLGWMMTKDLWEELGPKWPRSYWDDWMRMEEQRKGRACIRPELSRTRTFGKKGVSNGLFYEKYLKYIHLNTVYVPFTEKDLTYLIKDKYDPEFERMVQESQMVTINEVKSGRLPEGSNYRLVYHTKDIYKRLTKSLSLMDDLKAGVPRTGYKGVVSFFFNKRRVFLAPNNNWKGYDPSWS
ncbi:alpha-1,3-mannosyl-glycoprotein 2-beta-N-acetylglucosaminyltransferase [Oratosquilla oratoria]|uniref:alpha-1,3-mannosyl-glycoprotein 2-beta-N-acetylglucosaminyltransferase n=1 Tax=Oratosquilla oratoria TaxID=337810 RepID=UPI003F768A10